MYILNQVYNEVLEGETVPTLVLGLCMIWLPILLQYFIWQCRGDPRDVLYRSLCVYMTGIGTTIVVTDMLKLYVGYLRPIFYD